MARLFVTAVVLTACSSEPSTQLTIDGPGEPVLATPPLQPAQIFGSPVPNPLQISSTFGPRWKESAGRDDFHLGIDYYDALGTPLFAIGDGTVHGVFPDGSSTFPLGGNVVVIEHAIAPRVFHGKQVDHFFAVYLHTQSITVAVGDTVTRGQMVATMGMTGDTDFVHCHFETRVQTSCSLEFQATHPECATGFDPHVHPFLFVGGENTDRLMITQLPTDDFTVRYEATRGDLDLDTIETDFGTLGFDTREGIDAGSTTTLDNFDYGYVRLVPIPFVSASTSIAYELHFKARPAYFEVRDIYGHGLRYGKTP